MWAGERPGGHHHSHIHSVTPFQGSVGLPESRGQPEDKVTPFLPSHGSMGEPEKIVAIKNMA